MSALPITRILAGVVALLGLVAMAGWSVLGSDLHVPAMVEATQTFSVVHAGDGRVSWSISDGRSPGGPTVIENGVIEGQRGDSLTVLLPEGVVPGAKIEANHTIAIMHSSKMAEESLVLDQQYQTLQAELALLKAGGREEDVAAARERVQVAEANLARARREADRLDSLVSDGAGRSWEAEDAHLQVDLREAQLDVARLRITQAKKPARAEEVLAAEAHLSEIAARIESINARQADQTLKPPFDGVVNFPGGDVLVAVHSSELPVLQLAVDERKASQVHVGDLVRFAPTDGSRITGGKVIATSTVARPMGGRGVVWAVAALDEAQPIGATGTAEILEEASP